MLRSVLFSLSLCSLSQLVSSGAFFSLKFLTFHNPTGTQSDGQKCDYFTACDHMFEICLEDIPGSGIIKRCVKSVTTEDNNEITFGKQIGDLPNPVAWKMTSWPGRINVTVQIVDADFDFHDHVDTLHGNIVLPQTGTWTQFSLVNRSRLQVEAQVYCEPYYYSPNCSVYCMPESEVDVANYTCDQKSGSKVCAAGYTGQTCEAYINECDSSPCQNGATCNDRIGDFLCHCPAGFTGVYCDIAINECDNSSVTCHNGGVCVTTQGSHHCRCPSGYSGATCEIDVNECLSDPCNHNSTCQDLPGGYLCDCEQGYTGTNCEENINECQGGICKNGASCTDLDGSFSCVCSSFWQGRTCEEDVNECLSDPCKNGGTCGNINGGFLCACPNEFVGSLCEEDWNECDLEETCQNNSTCINSFGNFTCECLEGWTGRRCEEDINECETIPCNNFGTCTNTQGGHHCECPIHWTGLRCEEEVEECAQELSPCRNNATCLNLTDTFHCECEQGWTGQLCSEDLNECLESPDICATIENGTDREHSKVDHRLATSHRVCMNTYPGFVCVCSEGWAGQNCEIVVGTAEPFYLACPSTVKRTINKDLRNMLLGTHLFQGRELSISHREGSKTSRKGHVVTLSIYPVVTVDGKLMSGHEAIYVFNKVSDKIKDILRCSVELATTQKNSTSPILAKKYSQDWNPAYFAACTVLAIAVIVVIIIQYRRKIKSRNSSKKQDGADEGSISLISTVDKEFTLTYHRLGNHYESADVCLNKKNGTALYTTEVVNV